MDVVYTEELYFDSLGEALSDVEFIEPDLGQVAEERAIDLFDQLSLQEFWDYSKEWHDEPNCCVFVFQNLQKLSNESINALATASREYPSVVIHLILSDSVNGDAMVGGELIARLYFLNAKIPTLLIKNRDHSASSAIIALAKSVG